MINFFSFLINKASRGRGRGTTTAGAGHKTGAGRGASWQGNN